MHCGNFPICSNTRHCLGWWCEGFSYLDHPIHLVPRLYAWSSHPECPSLTLLHLGCLLPLLQAGRENKMHQHRWVIKWVALIIIIPYIIPLWTIMHFQKTNCYYKWQNQVVVTSDNPQSQHATMYFCVYRALCTYIFCELTSCMLLWKRSSHECLQEQKEAPWNRKESNVWERGCYLLTFDLLWRELECVFECRTDLQSQVHTHHAMGYLGISLQEVSPC